MTNTNHMHKHVIKDELGKSHRRITDGVIQKHHMEKFCGWFRDLVSMNASDFFHGCIWEVN